MFFRNYSKENKTNLTQSISSSKYFKDKLSDLVFKKMTIENLNEHSFNQKKEKFIYEFPESTYSINYYQHKTISKESLIIFIFSFLITLSISSILYFYNIFQDSEKQQFVLLISLLFVICIFIHIILSGIFYKSFFKKNIYKILKSKDELKFKYSNLSDLVNNYIDFNVSYKIVFSGVYKTVYIYLNEDKIYKETHCHDTSLNEISFKNYKEYELNNLDFDINTTCKKLQFEVNVMQNLLKEYAKKEE